jgi:hypothetical protein
MAARRNASRARRRVIGPIQLQDALALAVKSISVCPDRRAGRNPAAVDEVRRGA